MRCGFIHFPDISDPDPNDKAWCCEKEATYTCCDYGGAVCADHKCRCSKHLRPMGKTVYERLLEEP